MGKSNRIRANRVNVTTKTVHVKQKKKGMPGWLTTAIAVAITAVILLSVALSLMVTNGVFNRMSTVVSTDHYKVNANMLAYYFQAQYQSFQEDYSSFISGTSLDTSKSLKEQTVDSSNVYDMYLTGSFSGTWFDFFMQQTLTDVSNVLVYCEEADARNIELTDEEKSTIESSLDSIRTTATTYGYTMNSYLSMVYGSGVHVTDLRKAMQYSTLATKCASEIATDLYGAIDSERINQKYTADPDAFNVIDYALHTFSVSYSDIVKEMYGDTSATLTDEQKAEVQAKYDAKVSDLKVKAEQLKAAADLESFKQLCIEFLADENYDTLYDTAFDTINEAETAGSSDENATIDTPEDADLQEIRAALVLEVVNAVLADQTEIGVAVEIPDSGETVTVYGKTVGTAFAKVLNETKKNLFDTVLTQRETIVQNKVTKQDDDDFSAWAFQSERANGDTNTFETTSGESTTQSFTTSAYMMTETKRKDEALTRHVAYMLFQDQTLAKNAITALTEQGTITLDSFDAYAAQNGADYSHYENYLYGSIGYTAFDTWLYADDLTVGALTDTPISMDNYYAVAYYYGNGEASWYMTVKNAIFSEDSTAYENDMVERYAVKVRENRLDKVDA